jgi:hypothetical protein
MPLRAVAPLPPVKTFGRDGRRLRSPGVEPRPPSDVEGAWTVKEMGWLS